jgi:DNA-binding MarR family transcriptional regulator
LNWQGLNQGARLTKWILKHVKLATMRGDVLLHRQPRMLGFDTRLIRHPVKSFVLSFSHRAHLAAKFPHGSGKPRRRCFILRHQPDFFFALVSHERSLELVPGLPCRALLVYLKRDGRLKAVRKSRPKWEGITLGKNILFEGHLKSLGISAPAEWDVLAFVHRRGTTIGSAARLTRLIGYSQSVIESALDKLTQAGLIQGSHSNGIGLYKFIPLDTPVRQDCLEQLIKMAEQRDGRLQLIWALQKTR